MSLNVSALRAAALRFAKAIVAAAIASVVAGVVSALQGGRVLDPRELAIGAGAAALLAVEKYLRWSP